MGKKIVLWCTRENPGCDDEVYLSLDRPTITGNAADPGESSIAICKQAADALGLMEFADPQVVRIEITVDKVTVGSLSTEFVPTKDSKPASRRRAR